MAGSGHACYEDAYDDKFKDPYEVELIIANETSIKEFGRIVYNFHQEEVWITTWPQKGWRQICPGTGTDGGITEGDFHYNWKDGKLFAINNAVGGNYITGIVPIGSSHHKREFVLTREANYHPDGGQVFFPLTKSPYVLLLALPGDDIALSDFKAFYCDGSFGVQIKPDIWHQPAYPLSDNAIFLGKQGKVHACVAVDFVEEFGRYLKIPLLPNSY